MLLLGSLHDFSYFPPGSLRTTSGLGPTTKRACPDCGDTQTPGFIIKRVRGVDQKREPCLTCGGTAKKPGRGWVYVDEMDSDRLPIGAADVGATTKPADTVPCDACDKGAGKPHLRDKDDPSSEYREACPRCNGTGRRTVTRFELAADDPERLPSGDRLTDAITRRNAAGSYCQLEDALAALPRNLRRLVVGVFVHGRAAGAEVERLEFALTFVDALMPTPIVVPSAVRSAAKRLAQEQRTRAVGRGAGKDALKKRDKEIRELDRAGKPRQWIAREFGISVATVKRVVGDQRAA